MSAAPSHPARSPPGQASHDPFIGVPMVPPVPRASRSSSSPLRGCGRSTRTRSSPAATCPFADQPPRKNSGFGSCPGPRLHRETGTETAELRQSWSVIGQPAVLAAQRGGGWGIRTPEGFHPTRVPGERHRPLGESSKASKHSRVIAADRRRPTLATDPARRPSCELPQGRKAARVNGLWRVRGVPFSSARRGTPESVRPLGHHAPMSRRNREKRAAKQKDRRRAARERSSATWVGFDRVLTQEFLVAELRDRRRSATAAMSTPTSTSCWRRSGPPPGISTLPPTSSCTSCWRRSGRPGGPVGPP